jgi:hypothetical protein
MLTRTLTPTAEQSAIIEAAKSTKDSILISALAGAAKTSTLEMICASPSSPTNPLPRLQQTDRGGDEDAFPGSCHCQDNECPGHGIWAAAWQAPGCRYEESYNLLKGKVDALPRPQRLEAYDTFSETLKAIGQAKVQGYVPEGRFSNAKRLTNAQTFLMNFR